MTTEDMATRRLDPSGFDTDKRRLTHYLDNYERILSPLRCRSVDLLELGVYHGGSLLLWQDYFPSGSVTGLDINPVEPDPSSDRIRVYRGEQQDLALLDRIARERAPGGFDVIIDDCSHIGAPTRISFWHLFRNHLKPGGLFVVEDWGTGYWPAWPDGAGFRARPGGSGNRLADWFDRIGRRPLSTGIIRLLRRVRRELYPRRFPSHAHGMVGFIKELVDECGATDASMPGHGVGPSRRSGIHRLEISHGHAFIRKADDVA